MEATNINIRTSIDLKAQAQEILAALGIDMSTAINMFLRQVVYKEAIPFEIVIPNAANTSIKRSSLRGSLKGKVSMTEDFDAPLEDMMDYM